MSGGGGGGPSQTTTVTSNIPEYARPYVENMLEAGQRQLFNMDGDKISGFKPYSPYSTDPTAYFAGPSSLQQSAYGAAGQLQTPGQYQTGTQLATAAGMGGLGAQGQAQGLMGSALGYGQAGAGYGQAGQLYGAQGAAEAQRAAQQAQQTAGMYGAQGAMAGMQGQLAAQRAAQQAQRSAGMYGQQGAMYGAQAAGLAPAAQAYGQGAANIGMQGLGYGAQGAGYGQQAANMAGMGFGAGQQYASQVTSPSAVQAYMSPYQQAVTDVAKTAAVREAQMADTAGKLASARSGTYGGARQALMSAEREKNLLSNLANIQAQGSQSAYDKAMQAQQFGANLGLQGLQAGYQGLSQGMQGAQTGLSGLGTAMQGQQAGLAGLQQAGSLYGQGMQGAQAGLSGVGQQLAAGQLGLSGAQAGMQGAGVGLSGVGQQLAGGQLGLQGTAQGIQGAQAGMQGAGVGLSGVQGALGAGQYGLQGLSQASQAASTLGQLGTAQQQADVQNIGLQNQLGQQQQQYQQNIINQAIQDYATAQQYPYMQLSTMSNLLRGLPMQSMSTQQYQAQPSTTQQLLGLAGTGASLYGAMKREGGQIKAYKAGGPVGLGYANRGVVDSMRDRLEEMADTDPKGLAKLIGQTKSKELKDLGNEILSGIATANTGKLGTNMAGGGIIAFADGGDIPRFDGEYGSLVNDPMGLQNDAQPGYGFSVSSLGDVLGMLGTEEEWQKALRLKRHGIEYTPKKGFDKEGLPIGSRFSKESKSNIPTAAETAAFTETPDNKGGANPPPSGDNKGDGAGGKGGESISGLQAYLDQRKKLLGFEGPGAKSDAFMKALEERQVGMGKEREADRYLRAAEAFAKFGSTAGPMLSGASQALGGFAKGEAAARKEEDKMKLEGMKMQSDLEKAQRAEARGDLDAAEKFYNSAQDRANRLEVANISASATGQSTRFEKEAVERIMADKGVDFATALQMVRGAGRQESVELQAAGKSLDYIKNRLTFLDPKKDAEEIKKLKAAEAQILGQLNKSGGTSGGSGKVIDFNAIK